MDVGDGSLGGRQQIQFPHCIRIESLLHRIGLVHKFWKLPDADHAVARDDIWRGDFGVTVLRGVKVQQKLDQRSLEARAPVRVKQETAAAEFGAARKINQAELLAEFDVILRFEIE